MDDVAGSGGGITRSLDQAAVLGYIGLPASAEEVTLTVCRELLESAGLVGLPPDFTFVRGGAPVSRKQVLVVLPCGIAYSASPCPRACGGEGGPSWTLEVPRQQELRFHVVAEPGDAPLIMIRPRRARRLSVSSGEPRESFEM